ncbi:hypothetical protein BJX61DRAFT_552323 [Aspergillus egyptiacus]|nr:hypothetical protein BJX61DRAFT_552323 [Aspergillus egyptiacus]
MALISNPLIAPYMPSEIVYASQAILSPQSRSFGQRSPSTRSRRSNGSSSDETPVPAVDGFVEYDLRAGGPHLCEPPWETFPNIPRSHQYYATLQGPGSYQLIMRLGDICRDDDLLFHELFFCTRKSLFEPAITPVLTLLIIAKGDNLSGKKWISTARKLRDHLGQRNLRNITVEIMHPQFGKNPWVFLCFERDDIFPVWQSVVNRIVDTVGLSGIFSIGCLRVGASERRDHCTPTVLLGVDPRHQREWKGVRDEVIAILDSFGLDSVAVLIQKDVSPIGSGPLYTAAMVEECQVQGIMGASVSPHGSRHGPGTLGGFIELKSLESGEWLPLALTCSDCCFPPEDGLSSQDLKDIRTWKQDGVRVNDAQVSRQLVMDSPSYGSLEKGIDELAAEITSCENDEQYKKVEKIKAADGFVIPRDEADWKFVTRDLKTLNEKIRTVKDFVDDKRYVLGSVVALSGLREVPCSNDPNQLSIRDWALIQPRKERAGGRNVVKEKMGLLDLAELSYFTTSRPKLGEKLYKVGRAIGLTAGLYSGLKVCHVAKQEVGGKEIDIPTFEHAFAIPQGHLVERGDSGSLIFDRQGRVYGMLFGGNFLNNIGYFTHTADLIDDIKRVTGASDVRLVGEQE